MASRIKTIEFVATNSIAGLVAASTLWLTGQTLAYIPENSLVFKSCVLEEYVSTSGATAQSLTAPILQFQLGSAAISSVTLQNPAANSARAQAWQFSRDVTSYFTSNWTGTSMIWKSGFSCTGASTINHSAKLILTYQYEESTSNTQIKTIRVPIESTRTLLTTALQTVGGATAIPPFKGTYLPESGVTVRQMWLDLQGNEALTGTTSFTTSYSISGGANVLFWSNNAGTLGSSRWIHSLMDITPLNLTGATNYSFSALGSVTTICALLGGMACCTYEYNSTGSTSIYNSLILGAIDNSGSIGGTTSATDGVYSRDFFIEEPGTITIKESAVGLYFVDSGTFNLSLLVTGSTSGQTAVQTYTATAGTVQCGQYSLWHRIDSGGQNGKGLYLQRGTNNYTIKYYSATAQAGWSLSGMLILNYISSKSTSGVGSHAHTCFQYAMSGETATRVQLGKNLISASIPETYYNLIGYVPYVAYTTAAGLDQMITLSAEIISGESVGSGWLPILSINGRTDSLNMNCTTYGTLSDYFDRWYGDVDSERLNIKTARRYRLDSGPTNYASVGYYYTYGSITYILSGTCTYSSGSVASGATVDIYRLNNSTYEFILETTTDSNGVFSIPWIDNLSTIYADGYYNGYYVGRSNTIISGSDVLDMKLRLPNNMNGFNIYLSDLRRIFTIS